MQKYRLIICLVLDSEARTCQYWLPCESLPFCSPDNSFDTSFWYLLPFMKPVNDKYQHSTLCNTEVNPRNHTCSEVSLFSLGAFNSQLPGLEVSVVNKEKVKTVYVKTCILIIFVELKFVDSTWNGMIMETITRCFSTSATQKRWTAKNMSLILLGGFSVIKWMLYSFLTWRRQFRELCPSRRVSCN